jgi:hypothetical protein
MATLADWFKSQTKDYGQLKDAYPNAKKFGSALKQGVSKLVPTNEDFQSPEKMGEWSMAAAMNAPMGLAVKGYGKGKEIADILDKKYGNNIDADISGSSKGLTLDKIIVDKEKRNQGLGSSFLQDLTQYADSSQQPMSLTAAGDFGGSKAKQIDLYKRFGFVENKGKNKDYSISNNMYRNPIQGQVINNPNINTGLSNNLADYVGSHTAPMKGESTAPLHDLASIYPEDIYSNKAAQYYGDYGGSHPMDRESINAMHAAKGKPDSLVTMFRSVPSEPTIEKQIALLEKQKAYIQKNGKVPPTANTNLDRSDYYDDISNQLDNLYAMPPQPTQAKPSINNGDWVTLSKAYAKEHGQAHLNNNYKILSKKVPARKLFTNADSIHEFGYDESGKANLGLLGGMAGAGTLGAYLYGNRGDR